VTAEGRATEKVVVEFDHHSAAFAADPYGTWARVRAQGPVAWSESHGGFWVVTGYPEVCQVSQDDETFSSEHDITGTGDGGRGIALPDHPTFVVFPQEVDVPEYNEYRRFMNPLLSPAVVAAFEPEIAGLMNVAVDQVAGRGHCELVEDIGNQVPARIILELYGLPQDDWERWARPGHWISGYPNGHEKFRQAVAALTTWIPAELRAAIAAREPDPDGDMLARLRALEPFGEPMTLDQCASAALVFMLGGIDTATAWFTSACHWLSTHPDDRARLVEEPDLVPSAVEEMLRYFTPGPHFARTVTRDVELGGQLLREGDRLLMSFGAANHDEQLCPHPERMVLDRNPNRHLAFGIGRHRCMGSHLARVELRVMMQIWLDRVPDFVVDEARSVRYPNRGVLDGWLHMPCTFTKRPVSTATAT
jgi:cytochrome P450